MWLWITNIALLFGAELNSEIERGRELSAGVPAEEEIQLPLRDTPKKDKEAEAEQISREARLDMAQERREESTAPEESAASETATGRFEREDREARK